MHSAQGRTHLVLFSNLDKVVPFTVPDYVIAFVVAGQGQVRKAPPECLQQARAKWRNKKDSRAML